MFHGVIFTFFILTQLTQKINPLRACVPYTNFVLNGRLCYCDYKGRWTESNCQVTRRQSCQVGNVIWQGCNQCICNENGQLHCTNTYCVDNASVPTLATQHISEYQQRCVPFQSYYVNCSICICPASGKLSDAKCSIDKSCYFDTQKLDIMKIVNTKLCIPNLTYLFPCIQCRCSENGVFVIEKCEQKCQHTHDDRRCVSGTLYRYGCNICLCPKDSIKNESLCTKADCTNNSIHTFNLLRSSNKCVPRTFTTPRCLYCECLLNRTVNENSCLELDCSNTFNYKFESILCSPGELVPICIECFCFNNGMTNESYCTRNCSVKSKLDILEKVLNNSLNDPFLIDINKIKELEQDDTCELNTIYLNNGRYCLCPNDVEKKSTNKLCTAVIEHFKKIPYTILTENKHQVGDNANCEPNTLVDFDCNTCYCNKNGKIDPKWCTYDDCEAKRMIIETHKLNAPQNLFIDSNGSCVPGSISKVECNYCICPESGKLKERACTKNNCYDNTEYVEDTFTCEPLAYYEVGCNICYCPGDGLKNVEKCTKNHCEKSFLRTNECTPGQLFSNECNMCLCPPNGDKLDKVCTNNSCGVLPSSIIKLTQVFNNQVHEDTTRKLDLCFPGEEFTKGCDLCVCPDLGLKTYATCERIPCDIKSENVMIKVNNFDKEDVQTEIRSQLPFIRARRDIHDKCFIYNVSNSAERKECTPGSMYIIRCRQCICPYVGNINHFCRPLPKTFYCEQAFPEFNYLSMGRRNANATAVRSEVKNQNETNYTFIIKHLDHTIHKCDKQGKLSDDCFICECENENIIEEHCYKSDATHCINRKPTFLKRNKIEN